MTRRHFFALGLSALAAPRGSQAGLAPEDETFLEELERTTFQFFLDCAHPETGQVKDRNRASGDDPRTLSSTAATGFGLTALCIANSCGWIGDARERAGRTLRFLREKVPHERGWLPHFIHWKTGARAGGSEYSTIDTALCLAGVITARESFPDDAAIRADADEIIGRIDWRWMVDEAGLLRHGWIPEEGLMKHHYGAHCEAVLLYLLGLGAPKDPLPPETWHAFKRPLKEYAGLKFIATDAPLFVHQYPQAWFDFRGRRDQYVDYFENSVLATRAHRIWCEKELGPQWPHFDARVWGITASDSEKGYHAWGGPPARGPIDGTVVPCAAGGSLPFLPRESIDCLRAIRERFGDRAWTRFGFVDAFNPATSWYDTDVLAIDAGITLLMAENLRTEFVWKTFMRSREAGKALERAGFH